MEEPDLRMILELAFESIEHQAVGATKSHPERHYYQRKPERFMAACTMFQIPPGPLMRNARLWVDLVAKAAVDAHSGVPMAGRGRRDGELRRVERKKKE